MDFHKLVIPDSPYLHPPMEVITHDNFKWRPFPIFLYEDGDDAAVVPNERQLRYMAEEYQKTLSAESLDPKVRDLLAAEALARLTQASEVAEKYRGECAVKRYYLRRPKFGEFLTADAESRTYVDGAGKFDRNLMMRNLLPGRVLLEIIDASSRDVVRRVMSAADVMEIESPAVGVRLYEEVFAMAFPDETRIPFWQAYSTTSPEAPLLG